MRQVLTLLLLCFFCGNLISQNFHRNHSLSNFEEVINISGIQASDGGFFTLDGIATTVAGATLDTTFRNVMVSKFDMKGNRTWSKTIGLSDGDSVQIVRVGSDLFQGSGDSLYFSCTISKEDGNNKLIGALSSNGNVGWGRTISANDGAIQSEQGWNVIAEYIDGTFLQASNVGSTDEPNMLLNQIGQNGDLLRSVELIHAMNMDTTSAYISDIQIKADSSIMIVGALKSDSSYFLNVFDKDFNPILSTSYGENINLTSSYAGMTVAETPDTGYVVSGQFLNIGIGGVDSNYVGSFIMKLDSLGDRVWSKRINLPGNRDNIINGVIVKDNGNIMMAASIVNGADNTDNIICALDANGDILWSKLYEKDVELFPFGGFVETTDGGYLFTNTVLAGDTLCSLNLIKTDAEGSTTCEDTMSMNIFRNITISKKELTTTANTSIDVSLNDYEFNANVFGTWTDIPVMLEPGIFCPNEQIDTVLSPMVPGATAYEWSTGATSDTLRIFDDEQYTVTITVGEKVCFQLCDTVEMERYDLPTAAGGYTCNMGTYDLFVNLQASAGLDSIIWSTGAINVETINVTDQGVYTVTVVDNCGEKAIVSIDVDPPSPLFTPVYICKEDGIFLLSNLSTIDSTNTLNIQWSTGIDDDGKHAVLITDKTQYTATITDNCNEQTTAIINVDPPTPIVTISGECLTEGIFITANISNNTGELDYNWSTGAQDDGLQTIMVPSIGEYTVTFTDHCREVVTTTDTFDPPPTDFTPSFVCSPGQFTINSNVAASNIMAIEWSTGAQDDGKASIVVTESGEYSVTLTDLCLLTSTRTITIPVIPDMLTITPDFIAGCDGDSIILVALANSDDVTYMWDDDNNSTSGTIKVNEIGTYTVTATDGCGNELVEFITFDEGDLAIEADQVSIILDPEGFCETNNVTLIAQVTGRILGVEWSTGETTGSISVPVDNQIITLTALDECGNKSIDTLVNYAPGSALLYPQIFFPLAGNDRKGKALGGTLMHSENAFFGAFINNYSSDTLGNEALYTSYQNFELHVFNRFGQEVFLSDNIRERWDGLVNENEDEPALPDVYVWYATWEDETGCSYNRKGDITLFR